MKPKEDFRLLSQHPTRLILLLIMVGIPVFFGLLFFQLRTGHQMGKNFCQSIIENDQARLQIFIDEKLDRMGTEGDLDESINQLKTWIEQFDCIESVEISPDLLDSEPPIQKLIINLKTEPGKSDIRSIGIRLYPDKLRFDFK